MKNYKSLNCFIFALLLSTLLAFSGSNIKANAAGKCTVVLNPNNGSAASRSLATRNGTYGSILYTPSKNGYNFAGWYTSVSGGTRVYSSSRVPNSATQYLYAHWTPKTMTVTMELGYGSARSQKKVTYGSAYGSLGTPSRTGYVFQGWYTSAKGGSKVTKNSTVSRTGNHTIYAHWTRQVCTVNLQPRNGKQSTQVSTYYGDKYRGLYTPTKTGYNFQGWYTKTSSDGKKRTEKNTVTSSHALYAHWKAKTVQVTFNWNNELRPTTVKRSVSYDGKYGELPSSPLAGYRFLGWYTQKSGGTKINANTTMTKLNDHTIYARWEELPYVVTLNASENQGTINGTGSITKKVTFNKQYGNLGAAVRTGYNFAGWYTAKTGGTKIEATTLVRTAQNHSLYAHFTPKDVQVDFELNYPVGGSAGLSMPSKKVKYDGTYGMLTNPAVPAGFEFLGWYTASSGGSRVTANTVVKNSNKHTLWARWKELPIHVTLVYGNNSKSSQITVYRTKPYGNSLPESVPEGVGIAGERFIGWYDESGKKVTSRTIVTSGKNHTLYAKWEETKLSVEGLSNIKKLYFTKKGDADILVSTTNVDSTGGTSHVYGFQVKSNGSWRVTSTTDNVQFSVNNGAWSSSVVAKDNRYVRIKCKEAGFTKSGEINGTVEFTTGIKAHSFSVATRQITKKDEVLSYQSVKDRALKQFPFLPKDKLDKTYCSSDWEVYPDGTKAWYMINTQREYRDDINCYLTVSSVFVVRACGDTYSMYQFTPSSPVIEASAINDTCDAISYEMNNAQYVISKIFITVLKAMVKVPEFEGPDKWKKYEKYKVLLEKGLDVVGYVSDNIVLVCNEGEYMLEDLVNNTVICITDCIDTEFDFVNNEKGEITGDMMEAINLVRKAEKNAIYDKTGERGFAMVRFEDSMHKYGFAGFEVWKSLYKKSGLDK